VGAYSVGEFSEAAMLVGDLEWRHLGRWRGAAVDLPEIAGEESAAVVVFV